MTLYDPWADRPRVYRERRGYTRREGDKRIQVRRDKLRMRFRGRIEQEIARTEEKLTLLREIQHETI